jgi:hypothetical protein
MNLAVTIQAAPAEQQGRSATRRNARSRAGDARVARLRMALLAQQWRPAHQQSRVRGAMGLVA